MARAAHGLIAATVAAILSQAAHADPIIGKQPQTVPERYRPDVVEVDTRIWVRGLDTPWSLVFLPDNSALVSERPGRIRAITPDGSLSARPYATLPVRARGEGGLMGLALHPDFPRQPYVYAMLTADTDRGPVNRVVRLKHDGTTGAVERVIVDGIPAATYHNGGRIAFGPDGMLYITCGEIYRSELAQDRNSLGGKILRVTPVGGVPADNPFPGSAVWSYGHRNPQGLAWHPETKELFISEHGPSGEFGRSKDDEINVVVKGGNYGWPRVVGAAGVKEYVDPILLWRETGAPPSGIAFWQGALFVATLRSEALIRVVVERAVGTWRVAAIERWYSDRPDKGRYNAFRDAVVGPEGALYALTNRNSGDDKVLRISPR